jgi:hypothetical protein
MKKFLSIVFLILLLVAVVPTQAQDETVVGDLIVAMAVGSVHDGDLTSVEWFVDEVVTGDAVVDLYFTGPSASPSHRRAYALSAITNEEGPLVAMAQQMVAVCYTVRGIDPLRQREIELIRINNPETAVSEAAAYREYHGILFLHLEGDMLVQVENVML